LQGFNLKQVCKQIKAAGRNNILWWRNDGRFYITNRHWIIRLPDDKLPREILIQLFSIFAEIPADGQILSAVVRNKESISIPKDLDIVYGHMKNIKPGKITPFIKTSESKHIPNLRVIQYKDQILYVNDDYIRMVDIERETPYCTGKHSPVFFLDGTFAVLPMRQDDRSRNEETEFINSKLIAATMVDAAAANN